MLAQLPVADGVYCTAAINYFVVAPDGGVYACQSDLEAKAPPQFNLRDGWSPRDSVLRCPYSLCSGCDAPMVTRWEQTAGKIERTFPRRWLNMQPEKLGALQTVAKSITWLPTQMCNFTCVYCEYGNGKAYTHERYPMSRVELSVDEWIAAWRAILADVDYAVVSITGGEPLTADAFLPVVELISKRYLVNLTTNGSQNMMALLGGGVSPRAARRHPVLGDVPVGLDQINVSLHPTSRTFHEQLFKGNVLMLADAGFRVEVNMVAYPAQMFLGQEYKAWCKSHNIPFMFLEWGGGDQFGNAPGYTPTQRAYFERTVGHSRRVLAEGSRQYRHELALDGSEILDAAPGDTILVSGTATNRSNFAWAAGEAGRGIKVGARLFDRAAGKGWRGAFQLRHRPALIEARYELGARKVAVGASIRFALTAKVPELPAGQYALVVDVVDEGVAWFGSAGAKAVEIPLFVR
ncbi:hypothetical protein BH10PSE9_BH10PSE9_14090 [soil metagenome]